MFPYVILSHFQVKPILSARHHSHQKLKTSLDLGLTQTHLDLTSAGLILPSGETIVWTELERILRHPNHCFVIDRGVAHPLVIKSETTGWIRTLYPTATAPTTLVSGILMHRIKDTDPLIDTQTKISSLGSLKKAQLLDTATGLGYTAILAARQGASVTSVELDPAAIDIARFNPWSQELFTQPNILLKSGDILKLITSFPDSHFTHILHDPPTAKIAGHLYSQDFYAQLRRVITPSGKLFHYIGDPTSLHGHRTTRGVVDRLHSVGFSHVQPLPEAFGILASASSK